MSAYAQARERRLRAACDEGGVELNVLPGVTVIPPGDLAPAGADCYRVFTPYWRRWRLAPRRAVVRGAAADRAAGADRARQARRHSPASWEARHRPSCRAAASPRGAAA